MSDLPAPSAQRLRPPSWRDSRLLVGLLLVLLSTVLGAVVISRADDRVPMYAAKGTVLPGQVVTTADLVRLDVQLADAGAAYLSADKPLPTDAHALRELRAGELVPASAVGTKADVAVQPVTLLVDAASADPLVVGSTVDVYVNKKVPATTGGGTTTFAGPVRALAGVVVAAATDERGAFGGGGSTRPVQVLVPTEAVQELVSSVDLQAKITLVLAPGSLRKEAS